MEREGLWRLFFATGLPEAYLALREEERRDAAFAAECLTAFQAEKEEKRLL
ncbi:MAG: hypothetical protein IKK44_03780 [Clostridium sp.]|nr:hypothetical protein [Clostridium sp.]